MKIVPKQFREEWSEAELKQLHPKDLRMQEAFYFYDMFLVSCGQAPIRLSTPPAENQFLWITFADGFLAMLVSVEEMVDDATRSAMLQSDLYHFVKQLRNITVHTTVLGARKHSHGAAPLVSRIIDVGGRRGDFVDPKIDIERIRRQLDRIIKNQPKKFRGHVAGTRKFLRDLRRRGNEYVILREVFEEALAFVGQECEIALVDP